MDVRRLVSLALALIVAVCSATMSSPHVHAYGEHAHPEHQHGPASHDHGPHHASPAVAPHDHHDDHDHKHADGDLAGVAGARFEACDAGEHAIRVPGAAASLPHVHLQLAVLADPIVVAPAAPVRLALAPMDVRVHGPPPDTLLPARAPPLTFLA